MNMTPSDIMMQSVAAAQTPTCVLPSKDIQKFLLELIDQTNFPGKLAEFVAHTKQQIQNATLANSR